ncbi:non-ribosomal peptide synthetase [Streptomyces sp. WM6386]|uniref:non-ribosomal peptide synthetase n=1 Tax=Streptomyces sp. WM6386 TaxID=1415558 RepID=UPI000BA27DC1|nr:non-ribosomal peptide synthetase [Streptomyces sp. WM6386]
MTRVTSTAGMAGATGSAGAAGAAVGVDVAGGVHRVDALLLERLGRDPGRTALVCADGAVVSAGELRERVLAVAAALGARGLGPGDRVAVYHERSVEFVAAVLGVACAGAAHAAFDVADPPARTLGMLEDCAPRAVLTSRALRDRLDGCGVPMLTSDDHREGRAAPVSGSPDDPVALIFTSGSTGRPKASLISHRALVSRMNALQTTHPMTEDDRLVHHTTCTFDMYLAEIYWPLLCGATLVLSAPGGQRDADHLAALIRDHRVTTMYFGVSLLELFLLARDETERYDGLRQVLTGGEPLPADLVHRFHARSTASLTNLYGPSECTIHCTAWVCPRDPALDKVLIGSAVPDTELWVLDDDGRPVPEGEPGELYIGGAGLALGYLDRPELTAERFLRSPPVAPGRRLYRSGDLVRARPGGALEFLGRVDRQVKVRGVRIELGEIESTARRCAGVRQAVVVAHGTGLEKALAAFVVPEVPSAPAAELTASVRESLRGWLPPTMVPATVDLLDALPFTPNGKVDRLLLESRAARTTPSRPAPAADTGIEELGVEELGVEDLVAAVWCEALGLDSVKPDDDFFDLGGNSYKVVETVTRLRERLGAEIPLAALLEEPTVRGFAEEIRRVTGRA